MRRLVSLIALGSVIVLQSTAVTMARSGTVYECPCL